MAKYLYLCSLSPLTYASLCFGMLQRTVLDSSVTKAGPEADREATIYLNRPKNPEPLLRRRLQLLTTSAMEQEQGLFG